MNNNQCPYQGECEIYPCNPEQSCYTRQILDERNQAEKRVKELEEQIEKLEGKNKALKERIEFPYIKIDKANYGIKQRIYLRIKTWYKHGYSVNDIEKFIEYDSYLLDAHPKAKDHFIERLMEEAGAEYIKRGLDYWKATEALQNRKVNNDQ